MKFIMTQILFMSTLFASSPSPAQFSGLWYEIARTYNDFEKECVAATVEYKLTGSNTFDVTNRCFKQKIGSELIVYNGSAKTLLPNSASRLKLTYFWVFSREYRLVHYAEDHAIMASPDFQNVWIMSRTPQLPEKKLNASLAILSEHIDIKKLIFTPQDPKGRYK